MKICQKHYLRKEKNVFFFILQFFKHIILQFVSFDYTRSFKLLKENVLGDHVRAFCFMYIFTYTFLF